MRSAIAATPSPNSPPPASDDWRAGGFGVYVHWPFCAAKCPYCDFNSHVRADVNHARWRQALVAEIERAAAQVPGRQVDTVFFGGGTPSLMAPETVAAVIEAVGTGWDLAPEAEITLEANPTSAEAGRFRAFREAGVNRLSMGVQALNDTDLRRLGRMHTAAEARAAFEVARRAFDRVSFDLIYARQDQTLQAWRAELGEALAMAVDHLSLYQLTIEAGTRFGDLARRGRLTGLPAGEIATAMYLETQEICAAAGMAGYEVSNHARQGAESRHNLLYWRYGDYAGIGPGAHGRLTSGHGRWAIEAIRRPEDWLAAAEADGAEAGREQLSREEQSIEMALMGLRLAEGIDTRRHAALAGRKLPSDLVRELSELGLLRVRGNRIAATEKGRTVLDAVLRSLLTV